MCILHTWLLSVSYISAMFITRNKNTLESSTIIYFDQLFKHENQMFTSNALVCCLINTFVDFVFSLSGMQKKIFGFSQAFKQTDMVLMS